jgi:Ca2+-binding RTX toxin-like protein
LGLKHGHQAENGNPALPRQLDDNEFSVMTYRSYLGASTGPSNNQVTSAVDGSAPQTYMMDDIAALQAMYGGGNDTLRGGKGDDVLTGGPGDDIFAFARGDGNDIVHASSTDGSDTVAFDAGVAHDQL